MPSGQNAAVQDRLQIGDYQLTIRPVRTVARYFVQVVEDAFSAVSLGDCGPCSQRVADPDGTNRICRTAARFMLDCWMEGLLPTAIAFDQIR